MELRTLDYVVLIVKDLEPTLEFYCGVLGLELLHRKPTYAQIIAGTTRLGIYTRRAMEETLGRDLEEPSESAPAFELGFKVDDVDAAFAELAALGVEVATPPTTRLWGQRTGYVLDPDGNLIELAQDLGSPAIGSAAE